MTKDQEEIKKYIATLKHLIKIKKPIKGVSILAANNWRKQKIKELQAQLKNTDNEKRNERNSATNKKRTGRSSKGKSS